MGQKRQRLQKFLAQYPHCCFCGGTVPATTKDHIPPSGIFHQRKSPEGYEFPACFTCNNGSSSDDAIVALTSRIYSGHRKQTADERAEWLKQLRAFNERHPHESRNLLLTSNQKRRALQELGIEKPTELAYGEFPIIQLTPFFRSAIERFSRKLTLAFHYKHTGRIVPADAWLFTRFWTNAHRIANDFPQDVFALVPRDVNLRRDNRTLNDQFSYKFGISDDGALGGYLAAFRASFVVLGLVVFDASLMREVDQNALEQAAEAATDPDATSAD